MIRPALTAMQRFSAAGVLLVATQAGPPVTQVPPIPAPVTNNPMWNWLLGGGLVLILTSILNSVLNALVSFKKNWNAVDEGTERAKHEECQRQRAAEQIEAQRIKTALAGQIALTAEKDRQLAASGNHVTTLMEQNGNLWNQNRELQAQLNTLAQQVASNSATMMRHVEKAQQDRTPMPVTIDAGSVPVPVHEVGPAPEVPHDA